MTASSPALPSRVCSLMESAKTQGWPLRTIVSAVGRRRSRSVLAPEDFIDATADGFGHFDQWRPLAMEAFAWDFFGRIKAELGANGEFGGGVIEHVGGTLRENGITLRIGVCAEAKKNIAGVVHVHVVVDDDHV